MAWTEHLPRFLDRFINLGVRPGDTDQEKAHKRTAVLVAGVAAPVVAIWIVVYGIIFEQRGVIRALKNDVCRGPPTTDGALIHETTPCGSPPEDSSASS
jgi:hypothetical protein